jgi:exonuclease SbcC
MRINSLRLCNFRQHLDTYIEFAPGITGIIGPNGSGKSTLLEAIAWALYGMQAARGNRDSIRSYRAAPRASVKVELDFELGGHRYVVSRGLTNAELYLDGAAAPIATSISGVTELLTRRLGMNREEFFNTYFTGQKELGVMAAMGPADRAKFLSRVLGYERLRDAQDLVRKRKNSIEAETKGLRSGMPEPEVVARALADAEERVRIAEIAASKATAKRLAARTALDEIEPRWEAMQRDREALLSLLSEQKVAESERTARERDLARLDRELAEIGEARAELERLAAQISTLPALQTELRDLERASNEESRRKTLVETHRALGEEVTALADRLSKIETAPAIETETSQELASVRAELEQVQSAFETGYAEWVRDKQEAETKIDGLRRQLRDVEEQRNQIVALGEDGTCPICSRRLGDHMREVLDLLDNQVETIRFDGKFYRQRLDQLANMPAAVAENDKRRRELMDFVPKLERRLAKVQAAVQELASISRELTAKRARHETLSAELATIAVVYDPARHTVVRREVERLAPLGDRATRLAAQIERETQVAAERAKAQAAFAQADGRIRELASRREAMAFSEATFTDLRDRYDAAAAAFHAAELGAVAATAEVNASSQARTSAQQAREELARTEARLAELTRERRLHEELDRAFGEIRNDLNQEMRPELSDRASTYIRELTDGRYSEFELNEDYAVTLVEDAIPKPVISGGEEDLANLVLRLAISEMIAERAGQAFSLLILDEVFGSLDETRRNNVVDLLRRLQDRFEQVIVITHIESVREGLDRVVAVRYDEESGSSRVETESASGGQLDLQAGAAD